MPSQSDIERRMLDEIDRAYLVDEARAQEAIQHLIRRWDLDGDALLRSVEKWIVQS